MKIIEEKFLKEQINSLNKYVKESSNLEAFFNNIDLAMNDSLQDLSFKSDLDFFDEVSFILSVITTIISHPHLLNKREEIIVRTELANHVSSDMFEKTIRDAKLWKEDEDLHMVPESVYYYQHIDELKIYENIFIVNVIKLIEQELNKYLDFYVSSLLTYDNQQSLSLDVDNSNIALKKMKRLINRIKHIKNTGFYKTVNQGGTKLSSIHPTNILLKDRLYNYCYKFYKKMVTYEDGLELTNDFKSFYFVLLLTNLKEMGYKLNSLIDISTIKKFKVFDCSLVNEDFTINIKNNDKYNGLEINIVNKRVNKQELNNSTSLLLFENEAKFKEEYIVNDKYDNISVITLWNIANIYENVEVIYSNILKEKQIIKNYILTRLSNALSSKDIYSVYCPSCKSTSVDYIDDHYKCHNCKSKFVFFDKNKKEHLWFIRLRRKDNG